MQSMLKILMVSVSTLASTGALAQVVDASTKKDEGANLTDIVVTAQRRSESLQRVPVSVSAVTSETLENRRINDLTQISRAAPSLQVGTDSTFAVRGVGTQSFAGTIDSSVALSLDEVNLGRPFLGGTLFNDLERVEVLNGPQGLLFGKNASAGLLNIITARPKIGEFSSNTDLEFSSRETPGSNRNAPGIITRETINIPVSENSAFRINALYSYQEPPTTYVGRAPAGTRNDFNLRSWSIKGKYLLEPNDGLSIYAIADYNETHGVGGRSDTTFRQLSATSVNTGPVSSEGISPGPDNFLFAGDGGFWRDLETGGAQAKIAYTLDSGIELSNLVAWRYYKQDQQADIDYTSQNAANLNRTVANYDQYSNELRIALPSQSRLSGQAGVYYFKSTLNLQNQLGGNNFVPPFVSVGFPFCVGATAVSGAPPPACSVSNALFLGSDKAYTLDTESYAGFGQLTFDLTETLKLIAGGRYTHDEIHIKLAQSQRNYFTPLGGPRGTFDQRYSNNDFSWKLGAQYQMSPDIMLYGFYGRGYKGPGFNDSAPSLTASLVVREENSKSAEIGFKSSFFDRRVILNVSAFQTKFSNFQVQSFDTVSRSFQVQNAAKVKSKGFEATLIARPVAGLTLNGSIAVLDSKFDSFPGAQCYPTQSTRGCSATVNVFDATGLTLPVSPKFTSSLQGIYEFQTDGNFTPFIEGNWYHRSSLNYLLSRAPGTAVAPVDILGASFGTKIGSAMRISLFCKNCTNVHIPSSIITNAGDAAARDNRGAPVPKLSFNQIFGLDSVRSVGLAMNFNF